MSGRLLLGIIWLALFNGVAAGQGAEEEPAVRAQIEAYVAAYNSRDVAAIVQFWSPSAVYLDQNSGERFEGREAIAAMFESQFAAAKAARLSVQIDSVRFITSDVAIEDGVARLEVEGGEVNESTYSAVHVKKDGTWLIDSVRETSVPEANAGNLEQLSWLIGEWADDDENVSIKTRYAWAKNKSFISASFSVHVNGQLELEGIQIIGWDPVKGRIRSWVFDSAGGIGKGVWRREGDQWIVDSASTLADGSRGTATNIYTLVDEGVYRWKSIDRLMNGELLPEIAEVSVYRQ